MAPTDELDATATRNAAAVAAAFGLLWAVLAWANPTTTFHLGSFIVAAAPAYMYVNAARSEPSRAAVGVVAGLATVTAIGLTVVLATAGKMEGGSLLPTGGPALEAAVGALAGGLVGFLAAAATRTSSA